MDGPHPLGRLGPPTRTPVLGGQLALGDRQSLGAASQRPVGPDEPPVAGGHLEADPEIDADLPAGRGQGGGRHVHAADAHKETAALPADGDGLGGAAERSVEPDLHMADAQQVQATLLGYEAPAAGVLPLDRVETAGRLEAGEPGLLPGPAAPVEGAEGAVQAP